MSEIKIGIVGAGAVGGVIGALLSEKGYDVEVAKRYNSDIVLDNYVNLEANIECEFIVKENYNALIKTIKKLKKDQQIVIYLYYFQGFKYKEICKILNQSMSKTKMSIHRAKKLLEKFLKEDYNYDE